jgi:abortive infection bacteriophage resistance protein
VDYNYDKKNCKVAKTLDELNIQLITKGLLNNNRLNAKRLILNNGYFRLKGYFRYFQKSNKFISNTDYIDIIKIYELDSELRNLILKAVEIFEIAFRSRLSYYFSIYLNPYCYLDKNIYNSSSPKNINFRNDIIAEIKKWISISKESCILYYKRKNLQIPIWVVMEVLPFNTISKMFGLLDNFNCKREITNSFGITKRNKDFKQILKSLVILRNICAHHGRLWNRRLLTYPSFSKHINDKQNIYDKNSMMAVLLLLIDSVNNIKENKLLSKQIIKLIKSNKNFEQGIFKPKTL